MTELREILAGARCALEPLDTALSRPEELQEFLREFGWQVSVPPAAMGGIRAAFAIGPLFDAALAVAQQLEAPTATPNPALINSLREALSAFINAIKALGASPPTGGGLPAPFNQAAFWQELAPAIADDLLLRHVRTQQPMVYALLRLTGLAEVLPTTPAGAGRIPYQRRRIRWDRLPRVIGEPDALIREVWGWGGPQFNHRLLHDILGEVLRVLRLPAREEPLSDKLRRRWYDPGNPALGEVRTLAVPLASHATADRSAVAELGVALTPIPPAGQPAQPPAGFALTPLASGSLGAGGPPGAALTLGVRGGFNLDGALGFEIRPSGVTAFLDGGATTIDAEVRIGARPAAPWVVLGSPDGFRFEVGGFEVGVGVRGPVTDPEIYVRLGTGGAKVAIVIQTSDADGFLGRLIGTRPLRLEAAGTIVWSSKTGLHVEGSGGFELALPLHLNIGVGEIETLTLGLRVGDGLQIDAGISGRARLGPLTAVVENFGVRGTLRIGDAQGRLGGVDLRLGFKPPTGIGLAVDAGVVSGGGYLYFDHAKGEYAGALDLTFSGVVALKAIGLLSTRMPDGSSGYSLLIIITADFGTGIQLGFGFTLLSVGGLLGLNRTMRLQPLMDGVRTGAINSIMFPRDVVANAPRIISDLRTFFPPHEGRFLIGPMAKLGWGTPTLVSLSIGVIIEIPGNIAILGVLRVALPAEQAPIVVIQVNFAGAIEFDRKRVYFFASLFDSRILFLTIEGEMALVAAFGDDATFVLSVGGFHPRFTPPPLPVPTPRRISVNIINQPFARIRIAGYFAVTSNTVQFGAHADVFFGLSALNVEGELGFDALFQFSPFHFVVDISASFSVRVFGVGLYSVRVRMSLEGPTPWRARGKGSISFFFFSISVGFDITWGERRDTQLEPVAVLALVADEFAKAANWRTLAPASGGLFVSLRRLEAEAEGLVLHPLGTLRVSQRAVPLDLAIDKVGNRRAADVGRITVNPGGGLAKRADLLESFAPAQYRNMADAEKLSRPAFERHHGGLELAPAGADLFSGAMVKRANRYELTTIDTNYRRFIRRYFAFPRALFTHFLDGASISRSPLSAHAKARREPFAEKVEVFDEEFAVALKADNTPTASFASEAQARDYISGLEPGVAATLHVIPAYEVTT